MRCFVFFKVAITGELAVHTCHPSTGGLWQEGRSEPLSQNTNQTRQTQEHRFLLPSLTLLKRWEQEENWGISVEDSSSLVSSSSEPKWR